MRWIRYVLRPRLRRQLEDLQMFVAWLCPRWLVRWCGVRMGAHATTGRYADQVVPELTFMDALKRWEDPAGGDRAHRIRLGFVAAMVLLLGALLSVSSCAPAAAADRPGHKGARLTLAAAGDTVRASWAYKAPLQTGDTAIVVWAQRTATATGFTTLTPATRTRGTAATRVIPGPAAGSFDTVKVCVRVKRVGAEDSPNECRKRRRDGTADPHPGVDSLEIARIILRPSDPWVVATVAGQEPGDSNQQQFCVFAELVSGRRVKLKNSWNRPECEAAYQAWLAEREA